MSYGVYCLALEAETIHSFELTNTARQWKVVCGVGEKALSTCLYNNKGV